MPNVEKILGQLKAMKQRIDRFTVNTNVGDFWTIDVNTPDYWTNAVDYGNFWPLHTDLASVAVSKFHLRLVDELGASVRRIRQKGQMDQAAYLKLQGQLEAMIDWLESVPENA